MSIVEDLCTPVYHAAIGSLWTNAVKYRMMEGIFEILF